MNDDSPKLLKWWQLKKSSPRAVYLTAGCLFAFFSAGFGLQWLVDHGPPSKGYFSVACLAVSALHFWRAYKSPAWKRS